MSSKATISSVAKCPRCGYDLRGVIPTWTQQCPLEGTCTECGLQFNWPEVLRPDKFEPQWCVEATRGVRPLLWQAASTFVRSFWPWGFWSALRMSHPSRWGRIAAYLGLMLVLGYVAFAVSHGLLLWGRWYNLSMDPNYSVTTSGWPVFSQAALLPLSDQSLGSVRSISGPAWPYYTPFEIARYLWLDFLLGFAMVLTMHTCCALTFSVLPVSRRVCKVRWSHIVRMTVYGYALPLPAVVLTTFMVVMNDIASPWTVSMGNLAASAWMALLPLEIIWWSVATSRFLKMPHGWAVGVSVVVVGFLLPAVAWAIWLATSPLA
ncbi:MAG: hypothetical protein IH983_03735 [Planctomycetes bacterium]|nr:hypothetical protein [Planctomycetota bacterium]